MKDGGTQGRKRGQKGKQGAETVKMTLSAHLTVPPAATSSGCSVAHGFVRSLCGLRGKKKAKSSHGRSNVPRLIVDAKIAGGSLPLAPGQREVVRDHEKRSPLREGGCA